VSDFFPSLWEGLGEGAKLDVDKPSPCPLPKGEGEETMSRYKLMPERFNSFSQFWPFYVIEHSNRATRLLHLLGTTAGIATVIYFIATGRWWLFPLGLIPGYGCVWMAHFFIEKNKPATFQHPLWSFMGDYKMIALMIAGKMNREVERAKQARSRPG
jgi:hypothetical protein